jgi:hypothetical protein
MGPRIAVRAARDVDGRYAFGTARPDARDLSPTNFLLMLGTGTRR